MRPADPTDARGASSDTPAPRSSPALKRASGKDRDEWFDLLDEWGAGGRQYSEIADWLTGEHGLSDWWAQKLIVEFEEARGLRAPGVRRDGTFSATASKTVGVGIERLFEAFISEDLRGRWLPGVTLQERTSRPNRSVRFDSADGTRLSADFAAMGEAKSQVGVEHARLPDAATAAKAKEHWRSRLAALKELLED